ncbi:MAG: ABC transporter permease [Ignavibacteriae bacterium]|nr:ABC transporter permease [Ignavibacteriota bacterium]
MIKVIIREFNRIANNKAYYILTIFLPVLLFVFLSVIYLNGVVREIPVAVLDEDRSALSASYIRLIESTGSLKIVKYAASQDEMRKDIIDGNIYGCFCIPNGMETDLKKGKFVTVAVYNNTTNLITGNTILKEATTVTKTFSGGVLLKKLRSKGLMEEQALDIINPVSVETQSMYNSNYNYLNYLIPGLLPATFQMIIMLIAVLVFSSEFSHDTFGELMQTANNNILTVIAGKSIPHILLHFATALGIIGILYPVFNVTMEGPVVFTILFFLLFAFASFFFGMAISVLTKNTFFATEAALFINTPAFIFSGFVYPLWAMPQIHSTYALIMPFTYFMNGFLKIAVMKTPLTDISGEASGLLLFVVISMLLIYLVLLIRKKKSGKNEEIIFNEI